MSFFPQVGGENLSVERILGWAFAPMAWLIGVESSDVLLVGQLLGKKMFLNEFLAFLDLRDLQGSLSPRSFTLATYALCGFANFSSIAIQIGGIGALVPERRKDLASLGFRAMLGGTLAANMTACIAGIFI
jgi:CNT family concentrative nucleoside transporter